MLPSSIATVHATHTSMHILETGLVALSQFRCIGELAACACANDGAAQAAAAGSLEAGRG